ncbi:MAG: carboxypeptidase regulatory-like domain-containing protein, partial [Planctomycetes bacterium]|nr:carboxypeptidase regulatory-like domain-containing protein [Planctomycetota bacterium]
MAGLVLDVEGSPVVGVRVALHAFGSDEPDGRTESRSDTAGRFAFERPRSGGVVRVVDERWVTVLEPTLFDGDQVHGELTVVVAPNGPLAGVVVDEAGLPVAGATLWVVLGVDLRPRIGRVLDRCVDAKFTASTDAAGAFAMPRAPSTMTTRVLVTATGFAMANVAVEGDPLRLRIVLRREHAGDELKGRVLDATTRAPVRAHVTLGDLATATDAEGNFRLALWQAGDSANPELVALAAQRLPARVRPTGADWRVRGAWPGDLTLLVGGSGLRIRGRVEHADGTPVTDPRVSFAEPAPLVIPDGLDVGEDGEVWLSSVATGSGDGPPPGSFETPPVEPGRYRLRVLDPATLDELLSDPIDAGRDGVVLRMPALGLWPPLRGMVVDRRGNACAGADWLVERGARDGEAARHGDWHQADEQGRIDHAPLSRAIDTLCVKAAGMAEWVRVPLASLPRVDEFRVVVPIGCQARIELDARWRDADTAVLADGTGAAS